MDSLSPSHIIVGMSGGVDSSVAAYLLKKAGHHVEGIFMKNWEGDDTDTYCSSEEDLASAQGVCDLLDIPLETVNFAAEYWEKVFTSFLNDYRTGLTPNPDILCNKEIKFEAFLNYAKKRGADYIATGHYARLIKNNHVNLLKGKDNNKDQSYFLHALTQSQLSQSLFPVGDLTKQQVRDIAQSIGLKNHAKKDSTGICFIGERKFKTFLNDYLPAQPGLIVTLEGEEIGRHDGLMFYTMGQRQGLNIGGKKNKSEAPWYVADKNVEKNTLIVVQDKDHPALFKKTLTANAMHWINEMPVFPFKAQAKIRYRQSDQECIIHPLDNGYFSVEFKQSQRAVTPGQFIVFYQDEICLGGAVIRNQE